MTGTVFLEVLRRGWRTTLYWGLGLAVLGFYVAALIPNVEALQQYAEVLESMPPALLQAFGASDISALTTPEGFIAFGFFTYAILVLAVYAVVAGLNITANDEESGAMDVVLSLPLPRSRVILERYAAYSVFVIVITAISFAGLVAGTQATQLEIDIDRITLATVNIVPTVLLMIALTTFAAAVLRRRSAALAVSSAFIIGSYFLYFIGNAVSESIAGQIGRLSFFTYYNSEQVVQHGLPAENVVGLLLAAALLISGALWAWERRDIGA